MSKNLTIGGPLGKKPLANTHDFKKRYKVGPRRNITWLRDLVCVRRLLSNFIVKFQGPQPVIAVSAENTQDILKLQRMFPNQHWPSMAPKKSPGTKLKMYDVVFVLLVALLCFGIPWKETG